MDDLILPPISFQSKRPTVNVLTASPAGVSPMANRSTKAPAGTLIITYSTTIKNTAKAAIAYPSWLTPCAGSCWNEIGPTQGSPSARDSRVRLIERYTMSEPVSLRDASVQDIQLELLRRTRFNDMYGEKLVASLLRHRDLWLAALLDRPGVPNYAEPGFLLISGLIKLRDLPDNIWNADTLYVLTPNHDLARQLAGVAESEDWGGEVHVYEDQQEIDRAVGAGRQGYGLLSVWWD
jgi:hypothetical protein